MNVAFGEVFHLERYDLSLGIALGNAGVAMIEHAVRILDGHGRPADLDLLLDIGENISPGPYPVAAHGSEGLDAVSFPPRQTTICPLGPSSVAPITSALRRFRSEFEARITRRDSLSVQAAPVAEGAPA